MLKSLTIENFRCFQHFELQKLGRVNLLVGKNNSGKTSILEAIQILHLLSNSESLTEIMINRGEYTHKETSRIASPGQSILDTKIFTNYELDISHLFYDHHCELDSYFSISADSQRKIDFQIKLINFEISNSSDLSIISNHKLPGLCITYHGDMLEIPLISVSHVRSKSVESFGYPISQTPIKTQFLTSSSFTAEKMFELFDQVVLKPEEDLVIEALQLIEPQIQRLALVGQGASENTKARSNFIVKLSHTKMPIPLSSMGDGIWRILGIILAIVHAKDGILLIDEIDTGLHFSAMSDMWKLIWETAQRLNVQVFATTHNSDCWTSLAELASKENPSEDGITIHRIEKEKPKSVVFTEQQVAIAAERGIEVR